MPDWRTGTWVAHPPVTQERAIFTGDWAAAHPKWYSACPCYRDAESNQRGLHFARDAEMPASEAGLGRPASARPSARSCDALLLVLGLCGSAAGQSMEDWQRVPEAQLKFAVAMDALLQLKEREPLGR